MNNSSTLIISKSDYETLQSLIRNMNLSIAELLEDELGRATIVPSEKLPPDVVAMNSEVEFEDIETGKSSTVQLVYPHEANIDEGRLSVLAPIGAALIGLRVGQTICWPVPNGKEKTLKVNAVSVKSESA